MSFISSMDGTRMISWMLIIYSKPHYTSITHWAFIIIIACLHRCTFTLTILKMHISHFHIMHGINYHWHKSCQLKRQLL